MLEEFKDHIANSFAELSSQPFLLACSGGVDSVVLGSLCSQNGMDFSVAHCNFGLRGEESDADEQFVKELAAVWNKKFYVTNFDTNSYVDENKVSIQMAARSLRYAWFEEIMEEQEISYLVTAHQADDNLETFIINFSRGTGIEGLSGIPEKTDRVCRPLLRFTRARVLDYAKSEGLRWREDTSNADTKYLRNKIRHEIIPHLNELHPTFLENTMKTQQYLHGSARLLENYREQLHKTLFQVEQEVTRIDVSSLLNLRPLQPHLHLLLGKYGFTAWDDIAALLGASSGKEVRSATHRLLKDRDKLLLQPLQAHDPNSYEIPIDASDIKHPIRLSLAIVKEMSETSGKILYVDKETLNHRLIVRKWEKGDYFYPLGMKGGKKIAKFFKDEKVDVISKEKQWLLCSGNDIVWVVGRRADERFKVTENTRNILRITWQE